MFGQCNQRADWIYAAVPSAAKRFQKQNAGDELLRMDWS